MEQNLKSKLWWSFHVRLKLWCWNTFPILRFDFESQSIDDLHSKSPIYDDGTSGFGGQFAVTCQVDTIEIIRWKTWSMDPKQEEKERKILSPPWQGKTEKELKACWMLGK